jgi:hypothetical protein
MRINELFPRKNALIGNYTFLLVSLPFALLYFIVTVTLFALSLGTLVIGIGFPLLLLTFLLIHGFALLERSLVRSLLGIEIPARTQPRPSGSLWRHFMSYLLDPLSWTGLIYMLFVKLPLGIISFTLVLTLPLTSIAVILLPVAYLVNLFVDGILLMNHVGASISIIIPFFIEIHQATFDPIMFARSFIFVPVGLLLWFVSNWILGALAQASGLLVRALLAPEQPAEEIAYTPSAQNSWNPAMAAQSQSVRSETIPYE